MARKDLCRAVALAVVGMWALFASAGTVHASDGIPDLTTLRHVMVKLD